MLCNVHNQSQKPYVVRLQSVLWKVIWNVIAISIKSHM